MTKRIRVAFARPLILMDFHKANIQDASYHAYVQLLCRHNIKISAPEFYMYHFEITITADDELALRNPGKRLRGIGRYLLNKWPEKYGPMKVGSRLFYFAEV